MKHRHVYIHWSGSLYISKGLINNLSIEPTQYLLCKILDAMKGSSFNLEKAVEKQLKDI